MSKQQYSQAETDKPATLNQIQKHRAMDDSTLALSQTISRSHEVLAKGKTVFPFTLFPDTVTVDRSKLTIHHKEFFKTGEVMSIRIEDILNVTVDVGPFFGSLKIYTRFFNTDRPYTVSFLTREDAIKIKRVLQGYIIALQQKIDCSTLSTEELSSMLEELGK